jgi:AcrR family transcriptional regulator
MSYHHGRLREALLTASEDLLEEGLATLSLREAARRAGVSHNAPYRHFADKDALIKALTERTLKDIATQAQAATALYAEPTLQVQFVARIVLRLARRYPKRMAFVLQGLGPQIINDELQHILQNQQQARQVGALIWGLTLLEQNQPSTSNAISDEQLFELADSAIEKILV